MIAVLCVVSLVDVCHFFIRDSVLVVVLIGVVVLNVVVLLVVVLVVVVAVVVVDGVCTFTFI